MSATEVITCVKAEIGRPSPFRPDKGKVAIHVDCSPTTAPMFEAALSNSVIPRVNVVGEVADNEQPEIDINDAKFLQFDASIPVIVTLTKVGNHYIVAATSEEESQMKSAVSIVVNKDGHICGIIKRGGAGLDPSIILDMISVAKHVSEQLMNKLDSEISAAQADEEES